MGDISRNGWHINKWVFVECLCINDTKRMFSQIYIIFYESIERNKKEKGCDTFLYCKKKKDVIHFCIAKRKRMWSIFVLQNWIYVFVLFLYTYILHTHTYFSIWLSNIILFLIKRTFKLGTFLLMTGILLIFIKMRLKYVFTNTYYASYKMEPVGTILSFILHHYKILINTLSIPMTIFFSLLIYINSFKKLTFAFYLSNMASHGTFTHFIITIIITTVALLILYYFPFAF